MHGKSLIQAQLPDGSIQPPHLKKEKHLELDAHDQRKHSFEENYHPTFVAAILSFITEDTIESSGSDYASFPSRSISLRTLYGSLQYAKDWLNSISTSIFNQADASSCLYLLLGRWIYANSFNKQTDFTLRKYAMSINEKISGILDDKKPTIEGFDPALILLGTGIFRKLNLENNYFESFTESHRILENDNDHKIEDSLQSISHKISSRSNWIWLLQEVDRTYALNRPTLHERR